ncbi:37054_t:CDS:2, partial [Gigaspora margarita]
HKLTNEMSLEELSQYVPEILELLTDNKEKKHQVCNRLLNGYKFSKEQVFALIPLQRVGRYKSQVPVPEKSGLEAEEVNTCQVSDNVKAISKALVKTAPDPIVVLSVSLGFEENCELSIDQCEDEGIDFLDYFLLESVTERLNLYDVSNIPDKQALADKVSSSDIWIEKMVKKLERDVASLATELEDLDDCMDKSTMVDLIHEIVFTLINEKGKSFSNSSDSSEESNSVETVRE